MTLQYILLWGCLFFVLLRQVMLEREVRRLEARMQSLRLYMEYAETAKRVILSCVETPSCPLEIPEEPKP